MAFRLNAQQLECILYICIYIEINIRKTIRLIESIDKKFINVELALLFNETWKNENILPRYTYIYCKILFAYHSEKARHCQNPLCREAFAVTAPSVKVRLHWDYR